MSEPLPDLPTWYDYDPVTGVGNPSTPVKASYLNPFFDLVKARTQLAVDRAEAAANAAEAGAAATTDTIVKGLFANASSQTRGTTDALYATAASVAGKAPNSLTGPYSTRPAANTTAAGTEFYANDVPESYRSNGSAWVPIGSGGQEIGYAQSTASLAVTGATFTDIPGLTTTFVVGERPIEVRFDGDVTHATAGGIIVLQITVDGTTYARPNMPAHAAGNAGLATISRRVRVSGLTPGTTHTATVQLATTAGTATVQGGSGNPMSVSVVTL